jgi:folate-binding protein YgfZ
VGSLHSIWTRRLIEHGAVISDRGVEHFLPSPRSDDRSSIRAASVPLLHLSTLDFSGRDAAEFLQAQLTCDVAAVTDRRFQPGAYCDAKGRVLANFVLLSCGPSYRMILSSSLAHDTRTRLQKYVMRQKVLTGEVDEALVGLVGEGAAIVADKLWDGAATLDAGEMITAGVTRILRLSPDRYLMMQPATVADELWNNLRAQVQPAGRDAWEAQQIAEAQTLITQATTGQFLPQSLGLDQNGAVSFTKGCYPGQEIVARARYRGEVKRRLWRGLASLQCPPAEGATIWTDVRDPESAGTVINATRTSDGRCAILAVILESDSSPATFAVDGPDGTRVPVEGDLVHRRA